MLTNCNKVINEIKWWKYNERKCDIEKKQVIVRSSLITIGVYIIQ